MSRIGSGYQKSEKQRVVLELFFLSSRADFFFFVCVSGNWKAKFLIFYLSSKVEY